MCISFHFNQMLIMFLYLFSVFDTVFITSSVQNHIRIARNKIIIKTFGVSDSICPIEHSHNFIVCDINQIVIEGINDTKPLTPSNYLSLIPAFHLIIFTSPPSSVGRKSRRQQLRIQNINKR